MIHENPMTAAPLRWPTAPRDAPLAGDAHRPRSSCSSAAIGGNGAPGDGPLAGGDERGRGRRERSGQPGHAGAHGRRRAARRAGVARGPRQRLGVLHGHREDAGRRADRSRCSFKEGQHVKKGDVLVQIDPRPFAIQLESAQAALARDQANLKNATAQRGPLQDAERPEAHRRRSSTPTSRASVDAAPGAGRRRTRRRSTPPS